jgi:hypothetical protein
MISRRRLMSYIGTSGATIALSGCVGSQWWQEDEEEAEEGLEQAEETDENGNVSEGTSDSGGDHDDEQQAEDDHNGGEGGGDEEEQPELAPDEEDVRPDRDQYEEDEAEWEDLPSDAVSLEADVTLGEQGAVEVGGIATNETDEPIALVNIELEYLDEAGNTVGYSGATVRDLTPGSSEEWTSSVEADELHDDANEVTIRPTPRRKV